MRIDAFRRNFAAGVLLLATVGSVHAFEAGNWLLRGGYGYISPNDDSGVLTGFPGSGVSVDDSSTFAFTAGYMFTDSVSLELLGIWPANHDVDGEGVLPGLGVSDVGELDVFPPTLSLNYYFMPGSKWRPHIGAGINYTTYFDVSASGQARAALGGRTDLDVDDSWGLALNAGLDYLVNDRFFLSGGLWYIDMSADATLTGTVAGNLPVDIDVDPFVFMLGGGVRF